MIFISKLEKDKSEVKGWCTIMLGNCVGKIIDYLLKERISRDKGAFHKLQFGSQKG